MTEKQIGTYYQNLNSGEKGRFTAYLSLNLGGSPHSWQQKMLLWAGDTPHRPVIRIILMEITQIITSSKWKDWFIIKFHLYHKKLS